MILCNRIPSCEILIHRSFLMLKSAHMSGVMNQRKPELRKAGKFLVVNRYFEAAIMFSYPAAQQFFISVGAQLMDFRSRLRDSLIRKSLLRIRSGCPRKLARTCACISVVGLKGLGGLVFLSAKSVSSAIQTLGSALAGNTS